MMQVMRHSEQLSSSGKIVGEFVPPSSYISSQLLEYLSRRNAALASLEIKVSMTSLCIMHLRSSNALSDHILFINTA